MLVPDEGILDIYIVISWLLHSNIAHILWCKQFDWT